MSAYGFYFDAENCIGCRTCQVACKNVHDLDVGENYRVVRTFSTGTGYNPRLYHLALPLPGCDFCGETRLENEDPACVASCPQRVLEFGLLEDLKSAHAGEPLSSTAAPLVDDPVDGPAFVIRMKDCMMDPDFDEILV